MMQKMEHKPIGNSSRNICLRRKSSSGAGNASADEKGDRMHPVNTTKKPMRS